jgi:DNA-binding transcriptional LysR family regulator|tara:strand:- start:2515 stop:3435 length:921 start_codon:yes stop_codon:yes gene_type:complete
MNKDVSDWPNLRELEIFRAMIDARKTTAAAQRLGISQPAVSRALASLEARMGRLLFERDSGRLVPTLEALALNKELESLFDVLARINQSSWEDAPKEPLRIAAPPTYAHCFLQPLLSAYMRENPDQLVSLDINATDRLVQSVAECHSEIGFTDASITHRGVVMDCFRETEAVCVMPAGHRLAKREVVHVEDLEGERFISSTRRHSVRGFLDRTFREAGIERRVTFEVATSLAMCDFIRDGHGVAILNPFPVMQRLDPQLVVRPFRPTLVYRSCFVINADVPLTGVALDFMRFIRQRVALGCRAKVV